MNFLFFFSFIFLFNLFLFQFQNIPNFRDFVGTEYFYNLQYSSNISTWLRYFFNFLRKLEINIVTAHEWLFAGYITFGLLFVFLGISKIYQIICSPKNKNLYSMQNLFLVLLSFFLVYNPWVLERILMGQLGIFLGYTVMVFNLGVMFDFFQTLENKKSKKIEIKILLFSISILLSLLISPHYPILLLSFFSGYKFLKFFNRQNSKNLFFQKLIENLKNWIIVILPSFLFLVNQYLEESQYFSFSNSKNKLKILENFSLWDNGENFFLESLIGKNSWMSDGLVEKLFLAKDLGIVKNFSLYFSPFLQFIFVTSILVIFIFISFEYFHQKKSSLREKWDKKILSFALIFFPLSLILNFGVSKHSGIFREINIYFYKIPFSYIFRESGKFYALTLITFGILFLFFWKFLKNLSIVKSSSYKNIIQKIFLGIFSVFIISSFFPFLYLAKNLNQPIYPQIFSELQQECLQKPNQKILYIPLRQYATTAYSYNIFTLTPDQYLFACSHVNHHFVFLGNDNLTLNNDLNFSELQKSIQEFSKKFDRNNTIEIQKQHQKFLNFINKIKKYNIQYIIVDITDKRQNTENFLYNLVKYKKIYKYENNIFIFKIQ